MPAEEAEEALTGGNWNAPVRRGGRVHRISGPWSPSVHALLRHVRERGIDWLPQPFGFDEQGREVLSFLPGEVPRYPMPAHVWADDLLVDAGRRLREFHDACDGFALEERVWQQPTRQPVEVVCHNDFVPYNFVFRNRALVGVIDVDQAAPGPRVRDVAHLAYRLVPLSDPANPDLPPVGADDRRRRLVLLCAAYDGPGPAGPGPDEVLRAVPERVRELAAGAEARAAADPVFSEHAVLYRRDAAWVEGGLLRRLG